MSIPDHSGTTNNSYFISTNDTGFLIISTNTNYITCYDNITQILLAAKDDTANTVSPASSVIMDSAGVHIALSKPSSATESAVSSANSFVEDSYNSSIDIDIVTPQNRWFNLPWGNAALTFKYPMYDVDYDSTEDFRGIIGLNTMGGKSLRIGARSVAASSGYYYCLDIGNLGFTVDYQSNPWSEDDHQLNNILSVSVESTQVKNTLIPSNMSLPGNFLVTTASSPEDISHKMLLFPSPRGSQNFRVFTSSSSSIYTTMTLQYFPSSYFSYNGLNGSSRFLIGFPARENPSDSPTGKILINSRAAGTSGSNLTIGYDYINVCKMVFVVGNKDSLIVQYYSSPSTASLTSKTITTGSFIYNNIKFIDMSGN